MSDETIHIDGQAQVKFTRDVNGTLFSDALWFTEAEWQAITPEQLEEKKQERIDNWLAFVAQASTDKEE